MKETSLGVSLILDFVTSVEFIVATFEMGVVLDHYGFAVWAVLLYFIIAYQVQLLFTYVLLRSIFVPSSINEQLSRSF